MGSRCTPRAKIPNNVAAFVGLTKVNILFLHTLCIKIHENMPFLEKRIEKFSVAIQMGQFIVCTHLA